MGTPDFSRPMTAEEANDLLKLLESAFKYREHYSYNSSLARNHQFTKNIDDINTVNSRYKPIDGTSTNPDPRSYKGNPKVILDIHGMAIINGLLNINSVSQKFGKTGKSSYTSGLNKKEQNINTDKKFSSGVYTLNDVTTDKWTVHDFILSSDKVKPHLDRLKNLYNISSITSPTAITAQQRAWFTSATSYFFITEIQRPDIYNKMIQNTVFDHIVSELCIFNSANKTVKDQNSKTVNTVTIHDVEKQDIGRYMEKNISLAFDYYLLCFLYMIVKAENNLFKMITTEIDAYKNRDTSGLIDGSFSKATTKSHFMDNVSPYEPSSCRNACTGLCTLSCSGQCNGCGGTCTMSCRDACSRNCDGVCVSDCAETCTGVCRKSCSGCTNSCNGACTSDCTSSCGGNDCTGGCGGCTGCSTQATGYNGKCGCGGVCTTECGASCESKNAPPPALLKPEMGSFITIENTPMIRKKYL